MSKLLKENFSRTIVRKETAEVQTFEINESLYYSFLPYSNKYLFNKLMHTQI